MKIIRFNQLEKTERDVKFTGGNSLRGLIAADKMGFSVNKTYIPKGLPNRWCYKNHLEACYCIYGRGILTNLNTGIETVIVKDVMYVLDQHDDHTFQALQDTVLISIFNPPLIGNETHDENGNY
jgi:L-ectoine synthase